MYTSQIHVRNERKSLYIRHCYVACKSLCTCTAIQAYELRSYGVPALLFLYHTACVIMNGVSELLRMCFVFKFTIEKRSYSAYEEYVCELRIGLYELRKLGFIRKPIHDSVIEVY